MEQKLRCDMYPRRRVERGIATFVVSAVRLNNSTSRNTDAYTNQTNTHWLDVAIAHFYLNKACEWLCQSTKWLMQLPYSSVYNHMDFTDRNFIAVGRTFMKRNMRNLRNKIVLTEKIGLKERWNRSNEFDIQRDVDHWCHLWHIQLREWMLRYVEMLRHIKSIMNEHKRRRVLELKFEFLRWTAFHSCRKLEMISVRLWLH